MNVLLICNTNLLIPPKTYGGIERIVAWLAENLVKLGHSVHIAAPPHSSIFKNPKIKHFPAQSDGDYSNVHFPDFIDIIHAHQEVILPNNSPPFVFTCHSNTFNLNKIPINNVLFLSKSHCANYGGNYIVYNGIKKSDYFYNEDKKKSLLFMALVRAKNKNASLAIELAKKNKIELKLAGGYLKDAPQIWNFNLLVNTINNPYLQQLGEVGGEQKNKLLSRSGLLFYIVNWSEPCAVAPQEAFASGTPVIASPNGCLAEYIKHNENGYLVSSYKEAEETIKKHFQKPNEELRAMYKECLKSAQTDRQMTLDYLVFYEKIIKYGQLHSPESDINIVHTSISKLIIIKAKKWFLLDIIITTPVKLLFNIYHNIVLKGVRGFFQILLPSIYQKMKTLVK